MSTKKIHSTSNTTRNFILVVVAATVVILTAIFVGQIAQQNRLESADSPLNPQAPTSTDSAPDLNLEHRIEGDPMAMGAVDAPVVMIEYSDFRCPFCGVYARKTQPEIIAKYVDSGQLRIEWRDLPVLGDASFNGAVAARAAAEQDLFWEYNEAIYAGAPEKAKAELPDAELVAFAEQIKIPDMEKFKQDMKNPDLVAKVQADLDEGKSLGLNSTPMFVINNQGIPGAQPIDEALAKAK